MRLSSLGEVIINNGGALQSSANSMLTVNCIGSNPWDSAWKHWSNDISGVGFQIAKSRGGLTYTALASGDQIGYFQFQGADGSAFQNACQIMAAVDAAPAAGNVPGRLMFSTVPVGGGSTTIERMRLNNRGVLSFYTQPDNTNVIGQLDFSSVSQISIANGGNSNCIAPYRALVIVCSETGSDGSMGMYFMSTGGSGLQQVVPGQGNCNPTPTSTPPAGKWSVFSGAAGWSVFNNVGATVSFRVIVIHLG